LKIVNLHYDYLGERKDDSVRLAKSFKLVLTCLLGASVFAVVVPANRPTTITINTYQCGDYSVFLIGNLYSTEMTDNPSDTVAFVEGDRHRYTLFQISTSAANAANVDFIWQCSGVSTASGCTMNAKMTVNGMHTPNSLSLESSDKTIPCTQTKQAQVRTAVNGAK
jgi:hypothetical protein